MKLKSKMNIILFLTWLASIAVAYITLSIISIHFKIPKFTLDLILITVLSIITCGYLIALSLMHLVIVKRVKLLNTSINEVNTNDHHMNHLKVKGKDEISSVANKINHMIDILEETYDQLKTRDLETKKMLTELAEKKQFERDLVLQKEHLVKLAHYDKLTTLPNRIFFNEILNKTISHSKRHHKKFAILLINAFKFKKVIDAYGQNISQLVLRELSNRLKAFIRSGDVIARLDGDDFIILMNDIDHPKFVGFMAEKILNVCIQPMQIESQNIVVAINIAIAIYPHDGQSLEELLKSADHAMHRAEQGGGNVYQFYQTDMSLETQDYIKFDLALRKALENKEFILYYQPQLSLKSGKIKAVEALVRWKNRELGVIRPDKFITIAEETGLIIPMGEWIINEACKANKLWQTHGYEPISVTVNISPKQLRQQNFPAVIADALHKTGLDPSYLILEITESTVMDNIDLAIERLKQIHELGVRISIDDFGTGYTSINYLKQFPVDILKIDQSFVKGIPTNHHDMAIINGVIVLGHNLGLEVVAEGVETTDQIQYLAEHHCDCIQGYFLSRPLPENKIILQFKKRKRSRSTSSEHK